MGNWPAGKAADRALHATTITLLIVPACALTVFAFTARYRAITVPMLFLLGACGFGLLTPLQTFILRFAGSESALVGTANTAAFGAGITLGSLLGASVLNNGGTFTAVNLCAGAMTLLGLVVYTVAALTGRRSSTVTTRVPTAAMRQ